MSRTLSTDGCHELCLLHLSDLNRVRHALIEFRDRFPHGLNVSVSAVSLVDTFDVIRILVTSPTSSDSSNVIISSIIEMTLMIKRSGIIQRVDHRPSTFAHPSRRSGPHASLPCRSSITVMFTEMLFTHWSRGRRTLHLSLHVHDHSGVVLDVDEDALLLVPKLPLTDHHHGHHLLPERRVDLLHGTHT